jgi:hypothetical protein
MTSIINASPSNGITQTADGSGVMKVQSNGVTTNALAWVNFNGTLSGTITPRANYNVSSITKNSTGNYTLNFTNALTDANYATVCGGYGGNPCTVGSAPTTTSVSVISFYNGTYYDVAQVTVAIFGN